MPKVTFSRPESWTSGWKGKTTSIDVRLNGKVVGEVVGRENAGMAGVMMWGYELRDGRHKSCGSMIDAKGQVKTLLEGVPP